MNTGFEDARNLSWKLVARLQGWGGERLLESYTTERRPVFASTRDDFILKSILEDREFIEQFDPKVDIGRFETAWEARASADDSLVTQYLPNYAGSHIICNAVDARSGAVGMHSFEARAGYHLSPARLGNGSEVWDELGAGFTLLSFKRNQALVESFLASASALGVPLKAVDLTAYDLVDFYKAETLLIRPDHFIAWNGSCGQTDTTAILERAIGRLGGVR